MPWFSRARLKRNAPIAALRNLLLPENESARASTAHRLVWALFSDGAERERDFLWREAEPGLYYFLSTRPPVDHHAMFDLDTPKVFAPELAAGERLHFTLRANATIARGSEQGQRGKPMDVVMNALYQVAPNARGAARSGAVTAAGQAWLTGQGLRNGFSFQSADDVRVTGHRVLSIDRLGKAARLGILDLEGTLSVDNPERFIAALSQGFGRGKAFGNGMMLIRRSTL